MGWNEGYTILEQTVVGVYDLGKLDESMLRVLMEPFRGSDIDHGGCMGMVSKDGLSCDEIVVKIMDPKAWGQIENLSGEDRDEAVWGAWHDLTRREFDFC
jgi:hypothetical protein